MKTKVTNIAAKGGSTKFKITSDLGLRWQTSASGARLEKEVSQTFDNLDTDKVLSCLRTDCPYELYWYEKTANTEWSYNYSVSVSGGKRIVRITDLEVSMPVCNGYASDQYRVDASMVNIAKASAANAKQIVNEFKNSSVTEKLVAYKEMICYLTDYNDEAMSDSYADGYGDPWQLIWVFDGDDSTQVVCEGYSKAFQYLCDLSDITCYTVTGDMDGGTGAGPHMWNIVEQDGRYYMADITNSDKGTVGEDGDLFLNTPSYGSVSKGYTYETESGNIYFKYDKDTRDTYGTGANSVLQMTDKAYDVDNNTVKPSKPVISGISNKVAKRLTISWKKSQNAKGYEIYRRAGTTGSYRKVATIKSGNTVRYTNTGLRKGTKYYYRIRAYSYNALGKKVYSGWSTVKIKYPDKSNCFINKIVKESQETKIRSFLAISKISSFINNFNLCLILRIQMINILPRLLNDHIRKQKNRHKVRDCHQGVQDICNSPYQIQRNNRCNSGNSNVKNTIRNQSFLPAKYSTHRSP